MTEAEYIRIAAALVTEGGQQGDMTYQEGLQSRVDIYRTTINRLNASLEGGKFYGKNLTDILAADGQFAGVFERNRTQFRAIRTLAEAAAWSGRSVTDIKNTVEAMKDPKMLDLAYQHVRDSLEFRGSPKNHMELANTSTRGGDGDNQFLTSPTDPSHVSTKETGSEDFRRVAKFRKQQNLIRQLQPQAVGKQGPGYSPTPKPKTTQDFNPLKMFGSMLDSLRIGK